MSKKILLICNESMNVVNFRSELIKFLIAHNYSIDVLCADNERIEEIKQTGVNDVHVVHFAHRDINPFSLIKLKKAFANNIAFHPAIKHPPSRATLPIANPPIARNSEAFSTVFAQL